jgi:hypothetical protein
VLGADVRVLVAGSVTFQDRDWLWAGLDLLHSMTPVTEIVEGGRPGADVRAQEWACKREVRCITIPPQWERYAGSAEVMHHAELAKSLPRYTIATPCASPGLLEILTAHKLHVVKLDKMPVAKSPHR